MGVHACLDGAVWVLAAHADADRLPFRAKQQVTRRLPDGRQLGVAWPHRIQLHAGGQTVTIVMTLDRGDLHITLLRRGQY